MDNKNKKIKELLAKSIIDKEVKDYWSDALDRLHDQQKDELLNILNYEQEEIKKKIDIEKSKNYQQLLIEMKNLAEKMKKEFIGDLDIKQRKKDQEMLKKLEEELNNLK